MNRRRRVWLGFAAGAALVFLAVAGISRMALRLDREGAAARRQALIDESVRLALWRMDAALSLFLAQESQRPYFQFRAFVPADRPWDDLYRPPRSGEELVPSPLLVAHPDQVQLYFEVGPDCRVTSPQVPPGELLQKALAAGASGAAVESARALLERSAALAAVQVPLQTKPAHAAASLQREPKLNAAPQLLDNSIIEQSTRYSREYAIRSNQAKALKSVAANNEGWTDSSLGPAPSAARARQVEVCNGLDDNCEGLADEGLIAESGCHPATWKPSRDGEVLAPVWRKGELYLVRHVAASGGTYLQGLWLNKAAVYQWLLGQIPDLLPNASLTPATGVRENDERRLASLPLDLVPGAITVRDEAGGAPVWLLLSIAWAGVLLATLAAALLLRGALDLSERRGAFVSAVTHELRTPLTTFRMYTEMLSEGMVPTREQEQSYFATLRKEADRLSRLVENVLSYSRVEQGRATDPVEPFALSVFLDRQLPTLRERAEQDGLTLEVERTAEDVLVKADAAAAGQILFNLIDNACKYASAATDRRIHLRILVERRQVTFAVRDHGPGVPPAILRRLFVPFSKSAAQAAATAPGVGLGLALCRQLARRNGGDLRYAPAADGGAVFILRLSL